MKKRLHFRDETKTPIFTENEPDGVKITEGDTVFYSVDASNEIEEYMETDGDSSESEYRLWHDRKSKFGYRD